MKKYWILRRNNHLIPKYFELYLRNVEGPTTGCNGDVKDGHLCSGEGCAKEDDFKDFNCADAVKTVNPTSGDYLKPGLPCWEIFVYCNDGLYPLCEEPEVWKGSAEIKIDYTEVNPTGLIPQEHTNTVPTYEVDVEEALLYYVT